MGENERRDLILAIFVRFGLTAALCWIPFIKFGVNPASAGFALLIFAPCSLMLSKPIVEWFAVYAAYVKGQLALPPKNGSLIETIIHDKEIVNVIKITGTLHTRIQA